MTIRTRLAQASAILCLWTGAAAAGALADGDYSVVLEDGAETAIPVATISIRDGGYEVAMEEAAFGDYFLSMRPFRCIEGPARLWCHVPYPYPIRRDLTEDLTDLEYDFLFIWKEADSYGIDLWNGVYYEIEPFGSSLKGFMHSIDMNRLSTPPAEGNLRPVRASDLDPAEPEDHWLPVLRVISVDG